MQQVVICLPLEPEKPIIRTFDNIRVARSVTARLVTSGLCQFAVLWVFNGERWERHHEVWNAAVSEEYREVLEDEMADVAQDCFYGTGE